MRGVSPTGSFDGAKCHALGKIHDVSRLEECIPVGPAPPHSDMALSCELHPMKEKRDWQALNAICRPVEYRFFRSTQYRPLTGVPERQPGLQTTEKAAEPPLPGKNTVPLDHCCGGHLCRASWCSYPSSYSRRELETD